MSYPIMPPGSYLFWRIGMMKPIVRWGLTIMLCMGISLLWYTAMTLFFVCAAPGQTLYTQCAMQLAELASCVDANAKDSEHDINTSTQPSLQLLALCDRHSLTVQICNCSKPTKKTNQTTQQVSMTCAGTLTQVHVFLLALAGSNIPIANLQVTLKHQAHKLYLCTLTYDCVDYCA